MPYDGYSRRSNSYRDLQPVSIISVDPISRTAVAVTRTRHNLTVNTAYATGETITTPAAGDQWYVERFDNEWRLYGRIPFNDATLNIKPEEGQVLVGSATGPLELNGGEVRVNSKVFRLNGVYYRDDGTALQRSTDQVNWTAITASDMNNLVPIIANALANYEGDDPAEAITALQDWGGLVQTVLDNFSQFWNEICQNVFVSGLKRMGFGDTDLSKIVNGMQNFIDYLFGIIFCDFDGNLTPQTALARLRDLLAPIIDNPFVQGLQSIADILGVAVGNLLNDAVAGVTSLVELIFNIITCNWDALAEQLAAIFEIIDLADGDNPFGPANIIKSLFNTFQFLGSPEIDGVPNPVGIFVTALGSLFTALSETTGNLLQDAVQGAVEFFRLIFRVLTCDPTVLADLETIIGDTVAGFGDPISALAFLKPVIDGLLANPLVAMIQAFATDVLGLTGSLLENIVEATGDLMNFFLKVIKDILPFDEFWTQLFPFIDWDAVDDVVLPSLGDLLDGLPLWTVIFKPIDDLLGGAFTTFLTNLKAFFGLDFLNGTITPQVLIDNFLKDTLGLVDNAGKIILELLPQITADTLDGLLEWFQDSVLGGADDLLAWITETIFGGFDPSTFFSSLEDLFGIDLRTGTFDPLAVVRAFLELFFNPDRVLQTNDDGTLSVDVIGDITDFANKQVVVPLITTIATGLGIDLTKLGIDPTDPANINLSTLGDIFGTVLTTLGQIPATGLIGSLPPSVLGVIPVSSVSNTTPNLLTQGAFGDSVSVEAGDGWSWDSTENAPGSSGGAAKTTVNPAKTRYLYARQAIPVAKGDRLVVTAKIKTASLTVSPGGSTPISIAIVPFVGSTAQTAIPIGTALGSTPAWPTTPNLGQITPDTSYEVTNAAWTSVIVRLGVDSTATGGTVWWDEVSLTKTGVMQQDLVEYLIDTWKDMWDGAFGFGGDTKTWADMFDLQYTINTTATSGVTNAGIADGKAQDTIDGINQGITGATGSGALPSTVATNVGGLSDFTSGFTQSGSNLLPDPKISSTRLWNQSGLAVSTAFSNSTSQSLQFTGNGSARSFYFPTNGFGLPYAIGTWPDRVYYVECYVYLPAANPNTTATVSLFTQGTILPFATGTAISPMTFTAAGTWSAVTLTNPVRGAWNRLYGYFRVPTLRNGFTAGITFTAANTHQVYVDDLAIIDVTDVVNTNDKLYGRPTPADTVAQTKITGSLAGSTSLATDISTTYAAASGAAATASGASGAASSALNKSNDIITNSFNAWYGSGSTATAAEMSQVVGAIKSTVSNVWTVSVLPYGTTSWTRPVAASNILEFWVICVGGGSGGGKGLFGFNAGTISGGIGGAGGKWFVKQLTPSTLPASVSCSIGAGGAGATTHGSILSPNNGSNTSFGSPGQAYYVSTSEVVTSSIASVLSFYSASDSQPGNGGNGGFANPGAGQLSSGYAGESTPLAAGGAVTAGQPVISSPGAAGNAGASAVNTGQYRAGGGGGGGGGAGQFQDGGKGGNGGSPGGGGGGGGGANASGGPQGGNGGSGANGTIILLYRTI